MVAVHTVAPTIPLLFLSVWPTRSALGLVESLAHPGGDGTGFAALVPEDFTGRQLQFLKDLIRQASRIAVLANPTSQSHQREWAKLPEIGRALGVELMIVEASTPDELETAFETARAQGAEGIHAGAMHSLFVTRRKLWSSPARYRLPAMYLERRYVEGGGLISYGRNQTEFWRRAGGYVDKILKGEKPGDLPVQQPTRYDLIVNLKTAKALGITVPPSILAQADEVIE